MITKQTRKEMENIIYGVFDRLDESGDNTKFYKEKFSKMPDKEFDQYFQKFFKDENEYLPLHIILYKREPNMEGIEKAAKFLNIPLYERVALPFLSTDPSKPIITPYEVPVGWIHVKRPQQIVRKKNTTSTSIDRRDSKTGQVVHDDKNARDSDMENFSMSTYEADYAMKEFLGPRADDMVMKTEMYSTIQQKGYVSLDELTNDVDNKIALNTLNVYFIGMGLKTDLITNGYMFKKNMK